MQDAREGDWGVFCVIAKVSLQRGDFCYTRSSKFEITALDFLHAFNCWDVMRCF